MEGMSLQVIKWGDIVVEVRLPSSQVYEVTYTEPGIKGAATKQTKPATLSSGADIQVPIFVCTGDLVKVNCQDRTYLERGKK